MDKQNIKDKIIVALDVPTLDKALDIVDKTKESAGMYKVGMELFYSEGVKAVAEIKKRNVPIFLDLKLHDIPNTVGRTAKVLASMGVDMFNIHCSGGSAMMKAAVEAAKETSEDCKVVGVTVLTSMSSEELGADLRVDQTAGDHVLFLASKAQAAGLDGVVASPLEMWRIKKSFGASFIVVTPGIRPAGSDANDQSRFSTPGRAVKFGADYIVIGRPITLSENPKDAAKKILDDIIEEVGGE